MRDGHAAIGWLRRPQSGQERTLNVNGQKQGAVGACRQVAPIFRTRIAESSHKLNSPVTVDSYTSTPSWAQKIYLLDQKPMSLSWETRILLSDPRNPINDRLHSEDDRALASPRLIEGQVESLLKE